MNMQICVPKYVHNDKFEEFAVKPCKTQLTGRLS